jgi:DNA-binding MarR family transcriptional regulator
VGDQFQPLRQKSTTHSEDRMVIPRTSSQRRPARLQEVLEIPISHAPKLVKKDPALRRTRTRKWQTTDRSGEWRHTNIGRLLNNAVRRFEARVFELLAAAGHAEARLTHLNLTRNLDAAGTRMTELARRSGVTKQAIGELIVQCEELGLVKRVPDPTDGRAKFVKFTGRGLEWLKAFRAALEQAEAEMQEELGALRLDGLKAALKAYAHAYDALEHG